MSEMKLVINTDGAVTITYEGKEFLSELVTDTTGLVYAFKDKAPRLLVAAAMARLSRRASDLRVIYLDEFVQVILGTQAAERLIGRVVGEYGDDSVKQLIVIPFVVEGASQILTKLVEWGRLGSYLEQSTRYIFFDKKDAGGRYRYYTPKNISSLTSEYERIMNIIFDLYSEVVRGLTNYVRKKRPQGEGEDKRAWLGATRAQACDAARPMLPVATTSTVGIVASAQSIEDMIYRLRCSAFVEARETAEGILNAVTQVAPVFFERVNMPQYGGATVVYRSDVRDAVTDLVGKYLPKRPTSSRIIEPVSLIDYWPANELEIVAKILYPHSRLPIQEIKRIVCEWPLERKLEVFKTAIGRRMNRRHKPGRAFEQLHYEWQIIGDYGTFRDLQRHRMVDAWDWQDLSPYWGYDVPNLVKEAGFEDKYRRAFEVSGLLHETMLNAGYESEAQYATLLGHRMSYNFIINGRQTFHLIELRSGPTGHPGYRKIVIEMYNKLAGVHPLLAEAMIFVNKGEDPELTRIAAERATSIRLDFLSN